MTSIRRYNGVSIFFSRGKGNIGVQLPDGFSVRWTEPISVPVLTSLIRDVSSSFSLPVSFHGDSLYSTFYYQPISLCSSFFKSLDIVGLNRSFPFMSFSFFQFRFSSHSFSYADIFIHNFNVTMDVFFSSCPSSSFLS